MQEHNVEEAKAESRSLRGVNEDSRTELMSMDELNTGFAGAKTSKPLSRKKCIFRDALKLHFPNIARKGTAIQVENLKVCSPHWLPVCPVH